MLCLVPGIVERSTEVDLETFKGGVDNGQLLVNLIVGAQSSNGLTLYGRAIKHGKNTSSNITRYGSTNAILKEGETAGILDLSRQPTISKILHSDHFELVSKSLGTASRQEESLCRGSGLELNLVSGEFAIEKIIGDAGKVGELG